MGESETPILDDLEKGPWPSFVKEMKKAASKKEMAADHLRQLERSYKDKIGHWKHGGIVGVTGYGGGVIGRYSDMPDKFPGVREFHTMRVNMPSGWFYTTEALRKICDIWDKYGSGETNMHGSTGDIILLGCPSSSLQPCFNDLAEAGFDLGGSGSVLRTPACCVGKARCEWSCIDTLEICHNLTVKFQDEMHRPRWPYKFKIKIAGCANDCIASIARADFSIIGTWRDALKIDQEEVREYARQGLDIKTDICSKCPTKALEWDEKAGELELNAKECVRCMHCINCMPKALKPGDEKGATILIGGKATILQSPFLSWVVVPFWPIEKFEKPYDDLSDLLLKMWDWWDENGKTRERIGELIFRLGMKEFLKATGLPPVPQMVTSPRANAYIFYERSQK